MLQLQVFIILTFFARIICIHNPDSNHIRHVILYEYDKQPQKKNARSAHEQICSVYGDDIISYSQVARWFQKFKDENFDLSDAPIPGRPDTFSDDQVQELLDENPFSTQQELADALGVDQSTISDRLKRMGKVMKANRWVPHELNEDQKLTRATIAASLLARSHRENFLDTLLVADEKWIFFANQKRTHAYVDRDQPAPALPKQRRDQRKVLLCIWFDAKGVVFWELLDPGQTINSERYVAQLRRVQTALNNGRRRRRNVIMLHDNARPHVSRYTKQWLNDNGWETLPHPAYSPDMNPVDYHFNR